MEFDAPIDVTHADAIDEAEAEDEPEGSLAGDPNWMRRGQAIGRYVIVECLGVGGMGVVYSAWDPKLDRKLAIKLVRIRSESTGATRARNRLMREAQALARVRHPNVITVHDVGAHEGRLFVAMEFIEGSTLQHWLANPGDRPFRALLDVFLQAGRGLAAAHRAGLVHRDFKPENVMIGSDGRVLVLDFGIARGPATDGEEPAVPETKPEDVEELAPSELVEDGMTRPGAILGTLSYMSPEQRRSRPLDGRSDQFSFCVALWEALSGERPFGEGPAQKLLARMRLGQIRAMRRREVPRQVIAALHRGLAWNREDRFASMEALLEALNPRGRRSPVLPTLLAGSALAVAVALGLALGLPVSEPEPEPEPVGQTSATRPGRAQTCSVDRTRIDALWNPIRADAIADELGTGTGTWRRAAERLDHWTEDWLRVQATTCDELTHELHDLRLACLAGQLDRLAVTLDELATPTLDRRRIDGVIGVIAGLPGPDRCLDDVALRERSWAPQPDSNERLAELEASTNQLAVRFELGRTQARATSIESARQLVVAADELGSPGLHARALLLLANHLEREANSGVEAERVLLEAMRVSASVREFEIEVAAALGLAKLLGARGLPEDALRWVVLAEGLVGLAPTDLALRAACATTRATIALGRSDWAAAQVALERALELLESHGSDNLQLPIVASDLAGVLEHQGQRPRALELRRRALAIHERQHGPDHPRVGWARRDLAVALLALGESESARVEFSQALANLEANLGPGRETALVRDQLEWLEHAGPSE